jgi:uroporphyrinogen-III synthase
MAGKVNLSDATILLTRPRDGAARFLTQLEAALGPLGRVVISPLIDIVPLDVRLPDGPGTVFAFTSENGAAAAAALSDPAGRRAICAGERTARAARGLGYAAESAGGDVETLCARLLADPPPGPVLHATGVHQRGALAPRLAAAGIAAEAVAVYDQPERPLSSEARALLAAPGDVLAPLFSPRTAALFAAEARGSAARLHLAAISAAAAGPLAPLRPAALTVAPTPDAAGLVAAMRRLIAADPLA